MSNRLPRYAAAVVLALASIALIRFGAHFVDEASACSRGEECMGPFVGYFFLGIPAFAAAFVLITIAAASVAPRLIRARMVAGAAAATTTGIVILTAVLWQK